MPNIINYLSHLMAACTCSGGGSRLRSAHMCYTFAQMKSRAHYCKLAVRALSVCVYRKAECKCACRYRSRVRDSLARICTQHALLPTITNGAIGIGKGKKCRINYRALWLKWAKLNLNYVFEAGEGQKSWNYYSLNYKQKGDNDQSLHLHFQK